jgi:Na+-translocating ferredoxin:NAD+ oxidoreductase subunit G
LKLRTVINITRQVPHRAVAAVLSAVVVAAFLTGAAGTSSKAWAGAEASYFTTRSVLASFFPDSEKVTYETVTLTAALRDHVARRLGYMPEASSYTIFIATTRGRVDGYALIDDQLGEHQPITFATKFSPRAVVERVEIVAYREPRGDEVRDARFRAQFVGKTARDPLRLNHDIDAITGATISSAAAAVAIRRGAILVDEIMVARAAGATVPSVVRHTAAR